MEEASEKPDGGCGQHTDASQLGAPTVDADMSAARKRDRSPETVKADVGNSRHCWAFSEKDPVIDYSVLLEFPCSRR